MYADFLFWSSGGVDSLSQQNDILVPQCFEVGFIGMQWHLITLKSVIETIYYSHLISEVE